MEGNTYAQELSKTSAKDAVALSMALPAGVLDRLRRLIEKTPAKSAQDVISWALALFEMAAQDRFRGRCLYSVSHAGRSHRFVPLWPGDEENRGEPAETLYVVTAVELGLPSHESPVSHQVAAHFEMGPAQDHANKVEERAELDPWGRDDVEYIASEVPLIPSGSSFDEVAAIMGSYYDGTQD